MSNTPDSQQSHNNKIDWSQLDLDQVSIYLDVDLKKGLSNKRANELRKRYGKNILRKKNDFGLLYKFISQFKNPLVFILLIAGALTVILHKYLDSIVIFVAVMINVIIGVFQEERASRAFEELKKSQEKFTSVIRDNKRVIIKTDDLVPGDVVIIESGMYISADMRIIECTDLHINESALTGEWIEVEKVGNKLKKRFSISDRINMLWMGTLVSSGQGVAVVVETGDSTQMGKISKHLKNHKKVVTPIQKSMRKLATLVSYVALVSVVLIFVIGISKGEPIIEMFLVSIAVAVSVIPEGLPAALTSVLTIGMERILKKGGLVKNLMAAETLGSTTIILTDKTGTLTQAKMKIENIITAGNNQKELLKMAVLSSDAFVEENQSNSEKDKNSIIIHGRPIEKAIILKGLSRGLSQLELNKTEERIDFFAFNSENRFAASLNNLPDKNKNRIYLSGSPEFLLNLSSFVNLDGEEKKMTEEIKSKFIKEQKIKSEEGMRFLGIAYKNTVSDVIPRDSNIVDRKRLNMVVFMGIISFNDPIRPDVKKSIKQAKNAGARVIMITGDNPATAVKVANLAGLINKKIEPIIGTELKNMSDKKLLTLLKERPIFARILPSQKLRIVNVLRNSGEVVAMTGDGINDAPALRSADIGIAVGSGTEVAKESSDLILLNNSFSIIVDAIKEGRRIVDNIKKIVSHLISTSFGEVFLIAGALLLGMPLPILPAQILWMNIVEGGLLNFAFAFEPAENGIMKKNPSIHNSNNILSVNIKKLILIVSMVTGIFALVLFKILIDINIPIKEIRTIMFVTLALDSILFTFSFKNLKTPIWKIKIFSNKFLLLAVFISIITLLMALLISPLRHLLQLSTLNFFGFIIIFCVSLFNLFTIEFVKYILFERKKNK